MVQSTEVGTETFDKSSVSNSVFSTYLNPNNFYLNSAKLKSANSLMSKKYEEFPASYKALCAFTISMLFAKLVYL